MDRGKQVDAHTNRDMRRGKGEGAIEVMKGTRNIPFTGMEVCSSSIRWSTLCYCLVTSTNTRSVTP